jgi:hypothetical protein
LAMIPGLLFITYIIAQYALGMRYPGEGTVLKTALPLLALLFYALMSAKLLPDAFAGHVIVWPQRPDPYAPGPVPLAYTFGNVTQTLYLAINIFLTVAVAIFVTRNAVPYRRIIGAYMVGGYIVIALVLWQFANRIAGVPYPEDLLHSNPGWAIVDQAFGSVPRMQGPFSEPAALSVHLSGMAFCSLWLSLRNYNILRPNLLLALSILCVLLSTSTTGIVTIVVGLPLVLAVASVGGDPHALGRAAKTVGFLLLGGMILIGPVIVLQPKVLDGISTVVDATLTKGESDSYTERSSMDSAALDTVSATYGLGVGWGSFRSSSFIPGILANAGLFGVAMILWFIGRIFSLGRRARAVSDGHPGQILVDGFSAALCGQFTAAVVSVPMITSLVFYVQLGCILGVLARMANEPKPRARASTRRPGNAFVPPVRPEDPPAHAAVSR